MSRFKRMSQDEVITVAGDSLERVKPDCHKQGLV